MAARVFLALFWCCTTPQMGVLRVGLAGMELPHAAGLVIVGPEALRMLAGSPATATDGMHGERTELIEGEAAVGEGGGHLLDAVQLGVAEWVVGLLPRLGPLEGDLVLLEDLSDPLPADHHSADGVVGQVAAELADTPVGEGHAKALGAGLGRLDDEVL